MPLVSVLLPVFNAERHVATSLSSILTQTFGDFELLVIDDGSTDRSLLEIERITAGDARVRILSRPNKGLVETLNEGIQIAQGEWIARMDADDLAASNRLAEQIAHLNATKADICGSGIRYFGDISGVTRLYPVIDKAVKFRLLFDCALAHPTVMGRTSLFKENPYSSQEKHAEDYELWCRLAMKGVTFTNVPSPLLEYRSHSEQISYLRRIEQMRRADAVSSRYLRWYLEFFELGDFQQLAEDVWLGSTAPNMARYAQLLWRLAMFLDIQDPYIDSYLCAAAANRGINLIDAISLYREISLRDATPWNAQAKLLVASLFGHSNYTRFKRLYWRAKAK